MLPYEHMNSLLFRNDVQGTNSNQKTPKKLLNNVYKEFHAGQKVFQKASYQIPDIWAGKTEIQEKNKGKSTK